MHEWLWPTIKDDYALKIIIGASLNKRPQDIDKNDFGIYCIRVQPSLDYCQKIATTTKHTQCDLRENEGFVTAVTSAAATDLGVQAAKIIPVLGQRYVAKIVLNDGSRLRALPEFEKILDFWKGLIESAT